MLEPMKMMPLRKIKIPSALVALALLITMAAVPIKAAAEFSCKSTISYKWKKSKGDEGAEIMFAAIERRGADEAKAKSLLNGALDKIKADAFESCKKEHEDLASCISNKYTSYGSTLHSLGFGARKALEDAIASDCAAQEGSCLPPVSGEPKCEEVASADAGKEGKKDEKGKKK